MKYLVLHRFRSYGKLLVKGQVVDESEIRSPYLRQTEGKITPAVFSQTVPPEFGGDSSPAPEVSEGNDDSGKENESLVEGEGTPEEETPPAEGEGTPAEETPPAEGDGAPEDPPKEPHKPLFQFRK